MAGRKTAQQEEKRKRVFHNAPPTYFDADGAVAFCGGRLSAVAQAGMAPQLLHRLIIWAVALWQQRMPYRGRLLPT